jgi:hypothetical protein
MKLNKNLEALLGDIPYLKNARGENAICNKIALELNRMSRTGELNCVWFHVANERVTGKSLRYLCAIGMISGVPDYVFLARDKCVCFEVKYEKGRLSDKQQLFVKWLEEFCVPFYIARSWEDMKLILLEEKLINR